MTNFSNLSDLELYRLCKEYGKNALLWRQKFIGLLPEVKRRKLYLAKGFSSVFEFAKKLAGISEEQVRTVLNLDKKFKDKEVLHTLLIKGEVSVNKLARVASIATIENQEYLAIQAKVLPSRALETLVRDERLQIKSLHVQRFSRENSTFVKNSPEQSYDSLILSPAVKQRLIELQNKGINVNTLLTEFLDKREEAIESEKNEIAEEIADKNISRYIPAKIKRLIHKEHGQKCAVPTCNKPAEHFHHTLPFALSRNHDPRYIMPLCESHHIIAHSIDKRFWEMRQTAAMQNH